jgi:hypothetical protein
VKYTVDDWLRRTQIESDEGKATGIRVICPVHLRPMHYSNQYLEHSFGKVESCGCVAEQTSEETFEIHGLSKADVPQYGWSRGAVVD